MPDRATAAGSGPRPGMLQAVGELLAGPGTRPLLWERRGRWQIGFRWAVTPAMIVAVLAARWLGFRFSPLPIVAVALAVVVYNAAFAWVFHRWEHELRRDRTLDQTIAILQAACDYAAVFFLIHYTGGASSPLVWFLVFHVVITAIQFYHPVSYVFATVAAGGMWLLLLGQIRGWLPVHEVAFRGQPIHVADRPAHVAVFLLCFTCAAFVTAAMVGQVMHLLRDRVGQLAEVTRRLAATNEKLSGLYAIVRSVGAERHLQPILDTVTAELALVLDAPAVGIKLLSEDGRSLRFVAATGLPEAIADSVIEVERSPLNRRVLAGETLVQGRFDNTGAQLQAELAAHGIESAALAPLRIGSRIIGTLGAYSNRPQRFGDSDAEFLELAAELVAIAIEDARANEAIEALMDERTRFMLEVAHNLRAPLAASLGILEVLRDGYLGELNERQAEYALRVDHRLRTLHRSIGRLLTIARARDWSREIPDAVVDVNELARQTRSAFERQASAAGLRFRVEAEPDLPSIDSGADLLEQIVENLVSNAIKYTPEGGTVEVRFGRAGPDEVRIEVRDTGIGVPAAERDRLFGEFFRATNAKRHTADGTGLGLALVKHSVERHKGRLELDSEEGRGTTVVVHIPVHRPPIAAP